MKTRYYRQKDPRLGFQLSQQLRIPSQQKLMFQPDIQTLNQMYRNCAERQSQSLLQQPNQNAVLQKVSILLLLPLIVSFAGDSFSCLVELYLLSIAGIIYFIIEYMNQINKCKQKFNQANLILREQFFQLQASFQEKWPNYAMVLMRQWNQFNEACVQYIEIYRKQEAEQQSTQQQANNQQIQAIKDNKTQQEQILVIDNQ